MTTKKELSPWEQSIEKFEASTKEVSKRTKQTYMTLGIIFMIILSVGLFFTFYTERNFIPFVIAVLFYMVVSVFVIRALKEKPVSIGIRFNRKKASLGYDLQRIFIPVIKKGEKIQRTSDRIYFKFYAEGVDFSIPITKEGVFIIKTSEKKGISKLVFVFNNKSMKREKELFYAERIDIEPIKSFLEDCMKMKLK